jgi:opacity protein-like surface antigen
VTVSAQAQDPRIELQGWAGYTFSNGVSGDPQEGSDGRIYDRIDPKNSPSYGASIGFFAYNFGYADDPVRPYVLGGLGVTRCSNVTIAGVLDTREVPSQSRFSTTWGLGVKVYPSHNLGLFAEGRWTPTYVKTDAAGWWCDPWWGCWVVGNAQYANQLELGGGITLRF